MFCAKVIVFSNHGCLESKTSWELLMVYYKGAEMVSNQEALRIGLRK